jgi:hypothetical protein
MPTTAFGETNGERRVGRGGDHAPRARQRAAGQFLSRCMQSMASTIALVFGPIRISTATTLLCAAIVSFRSLIPRCLLAISRGAADRNTCWGDSPFEPQQMFVFRFGEQ